MRLVELAGARRFAVAVSIGALSAFAAATAASAQSSMAAQTDPNVQRVAVQPVAISRVPASVPQAPVAEAAAAAPDAVKGDTTRTRFVVGLEKPTEFQVFSLSNPNRVIVDMPDVRMQLPAQTNGTPVGLVKSFYGGLFSSRKDPGRHFGYDGGRGRKSGHRKGPGRQGASPGDRCRTGRPGSPGAASQTVEGQCPACSFRQRRWRASCDGECLVCDRAAAAAPNRRCGQN